MTRRTPRPAVALLLSLALLVTPTAAVAAPGAASATGPDQPAVTSDDEGGVPWPAQRFTAVVGGTTGRAQISGNPNLPNASGRLQVVAPTGTRIVETWTSGFESARLQIQDGGRSAISPTETVLWSGFGSLSTAVTFAVDADVVPGTVLDDGVITVTRDGGATLTASGRVEVATEGLMISRSPADQSVEEHHTATFTAAAVAVPEASVQWESSSDGGVTWADVPGAVTGTLEVGPVTRDLTGTRYQAVFTHVHGTRTTDAAVLTVTPGPPAITEQPRSVTVLEGATAELAVAHTDAGVETTVQWHVSTDAGTTFALVPDTVHPDGADPLRLTLPDVGAEMHGWLFRVQLTNAAGSTWSEVAALHVIARWPDAVGQAPPGATTEVLVHDPRGGRTGLMEVTAPAGTRITAGRADSSDAVPFHIDPDGRRAVSDPAVWGGTGHGALITLAVDQDQVPGSALGDGSAVVVDVLGARQAQGSVAVTVLGRPDVLSQPQDRTVIESRGATFAVDVGGFPAPDVQWQESRDGGQTWSDLDGRTSTTMTIPAVTADLHGRQYQAVVTNAVGSVTSDPATLRVLRVGPLQLTVTPRVLLVDSLTGA